LRSPALGAHFYSKLANLLFTMLHVAAPTIAVAAHPGASRTGCGTEGSGPLNRVIHLAPLVTQSAAFGARPMLRAVTDPVPGSSPWTQRRCPRHRRGPPGTARQLWDLSVQLTGLAPAITHRLKMAGDVPTG
jgi:hypothetical protein